jgi:hypothetical protein
MEAPIDKGDEAPVAGRAVRMKRSPGGRHRVVKVLLTEEERATLAGRAVASGVSLQRYLIEAGMSGSVGDGAARRRAERELTQSRGVLRVYHRHGRRTLRRATRTAGVQALGRQSR